jgi:hypothetical protein
MFGINTSCPSIFTVLFGVSIVVLRQIYERRSQQRLQDGNLTMTGEAYTKWQSDNYAWDWIAAQLNLTIIGDYVPPVPEPIVPTEPTEPLNSILADLRQDAPIDEIVTE